MVSAGDFLYQRWSTDPRMIPMDEIAAFKDALGPLDNDQFVTVSCFPSIDQSSCDIAEKYRDWFADHWSLRSLQSENGANLPPDLVNRVWIYTQAEQNRPSGAVRLHKALDEAGMNPGYRLNGGMGSHDFGFCVGPSHQ
jgi:hypothetical protein